MSSKIFKIIRWSLIILLIIFAIWFVNKIGVEQLRANIKQFGVWAPLIVVGLRLVSVIIPALPVTAYAILSGGIFGFYQGLAIIAIADLIACTVNFYIAKKYGRNAVQKLVGQQFMNKVDGLGQKYLERNVFLLTGFMVSGLFDFVSYAVGLTQTTWRTFILALLASVVISKPPAVAIGAGAFSGGYSLLGFAILGIFALGLITAWLNRKQNQND